MLAFLYAAAILVLTIFGLQAGWLALRQSASRRSVEAFEVPEHSPGECPTVTVQLPVYNEPAVVERLIDACARLDYPRERLEIQVLDDSTDETTMLARRRVNHWSSRGVDVVHIQRADRTGFKAGALQNGLRQAKGCFIAIFDADFVPEADFLRRLVPLFENEGIGMVQARWGHLNGDASLLTAAQAAGLDAHFAVEQEGRQDAGCFIHFNGTAGIWRRECIESAGGWQHDTLTEDLDLSYRAQLHGWTLRYVPETEAPAELPQTMDALRTQQFRWAKGAIETARKHLRGLWAAPIAWKKKLAGSLHLTGHLAFPALLIAMLTHAPLLVQSAGAGGFSDLYLALVSVGVAGFAGFALAHVVAQRRLYPDWLRRLRYFPVFLVGTMGLALSNSLAVAAAILGRRSPFVRTPKQGDGAGPPVSLSAEVPPIAWAEAALATYGWIGVGALMAYGLWIAVPFQAAFAIGCTVVAAHSFMEIRMAQKLEWKVEKVVG